MRGEGLATEAFADRERRRRCALILQHRKGCIHEYQCARLLQSVGGAETDVAALVLGEAIDPSAGGPVEGHFLAVVEKEILAEVFAETLEEIAQVADDRVIAQDRVLLLGNVADVEVSQSGQQRGGQEGPEAHAEDAQDALHALISRVKSAASYRPSRKASAQLSRGRS